MEDNNKSEWINTVLSQLSQSDGPLPVKTIEGCGKACLKASGVLDKIKTIRQSVADKNDIDLLLATYKKELYDNRPNLYQINSDIYLEYDNCACGMVTEGGVNHPFLCHCTVGYTRQIFETLFDRPVQVTLLASILNGDPICKQKITVLDQK